MKVIIYLLVISSMVNATIGLLFGRGRGGQQHQQEEHIVKHLHQHEIKIIHEGGIGGYHEGGGNVAGGHIGGGNDAQIVLVDNIGGGGGGGVGHGGFGHNTGIFSGGGHFSNFGGSHGSSYGDIGSFAHGSGISGPVPTQIINLVHGGDQQEQYSSHGSGNILAGGFSGSQIVGFIEEGHARGFGGGHTHGIGGGHGLAGGFTAPQLVEFVEEGHSRGFGGGHSHGAFDGFTDAQIVQFVEEGHARGYGGGHSHGRNRKFSVPEIAGFVEDGLDHGFGGGHSHSNGGDSINGDLTSILGFVEDEHLHDNGNVQFSNGGSGGNEQIIQVLHGGHQNSIDYEGGHRQQQQQHIFKIIRDDNQHSINNGGNSFHDHGSGENIKLVKVIADNHHGHGQGFSHGGGHEKYVKIIH